MALKEYHRKRDFQQTDEPAGHRPVKGGWQYLIQKHAASRLHYDFRLELDGVLKSWAVPKGPSLDPSVKSLAVHVEDHPIEYGSFEGVIPKGQYGGGTVMLWDRGTWVPEGDAGKSYGLGKLVFRLAGERLKGRWALIRMGGKAGQNGKNWLLKKLDDEEARSAGDVDVLKNVTSVATGRTMDEIAGNKQVKPARVSKSAKPGTSSGSGRPDTLIRKHDAVLKIEPSRLRGARRSPMPARVAPELPLLVDQLPDDAGWLYELKLDGYRMICVVREGAASLFTRRWNDWTDRFPTICRAVEGLGLENVILDGEVAAIRKDGTTDFQALQNLLKRGDDQQVVYFVFDLLHYRGHDLRKVPLLERKKLLSRILSKKHRSETIRYNDHIAEEGNQVFSSACRHGLEGIVAKRADSHYVERRTADWVKIKCLKRQEFVIGGWTEPAGSRTSLGALLVGYYCGPSELVYCGRVGTGFSQQSLRSLHKALQGQERNQSPFREPPSGIAAHGVIHWAAPELVAEVRFAAWTADGILRHASFEGLREDKEPQEITLELPVARAGSGAETGSDDSRSRKQISTASRGAREDSRRKPTDVFAGVRLTHPDRILFPDERITKRDVAAYYASIAPFILPHIVGRPLSLVRCPNGTTKACFFQRHLGISMPRSVRGIEVKEKAGSVAYLVIDDLAGLISLVQLGVLEIHPWGSREDRLDSPDRLIIDIDPGEGVHWNDVVRAARQVKQRLEHLGLESFLRTTGGKGLHVVVPIVRRGSWDDLKSFAKTFADSLVREHPYRYVAQPSKAKRTGRIYIDYLRNEQGATAVASYSTRARQGATVATPISWDELSDSLTPAHFNTQTVPERLGKMKDDPWPGFFELRQSLSKEMRRQLKRM